MRYMSGVTLVFFLLLGVCLSIGCSEKSIEPDSNPLPSTAMKHVWSKRFGLSGYQTASAVATDASGNIVVVGYFEGSIEFGGGVLTNTGENIFIAKLGSDGAHLWSKSCGGPGSYIPPVLAVDLSGAVIIAGQFKGTVDFGGGPLTSAGDWDIFVAKFDCDGTHLWSKSFGGSESQGADAVAVDASGNVIVTGTFWGTVDFGGDVFTSATNGDIYVAKFGPDGNHLWSKRFGEGGSQFARSVAVDASGHVIVTGEYSGIIDFGGGALARASILDIFVAELDSDGAHLWSTCFGDEDIESPVGVAVDTSGNVFLTGRLVGADPYTQSATVFVSKLGADGTHLWSKRFGDENHRYVRSIAVDASGNSFITGYFEGAADFGGSTLRSAGWYDIFVAKYGPDGAHLWSARFGDDTYQVAEAVAVDASGNAVITGGFYGTFDFGGGELMSFGGDVFVAKFCR